MNLVANAPGGGDNADIPFDGDDLAGDLATYATNAKSDAGDVEDDAREDLAVITGPAGADGTSVTATVTEDGVRIVNTDGTIVELFHGTNGADGVTMEGADGANGADGTTRWN